MGTGVRATIAYLARAPGSKKQKENDMIPRLRRLKEAGAAFIFRSATTNVTPAIQSGLPSRPNRETQSANQASLLTTRPFIIKSGLEQRGSIIKPSNQGDIP